jgi:hypothetical protein
MRFVGDNGTFDETGVDQLNCRGTTFGFASRSGKPCSYATICSNASRK